MEKNNLNRAFSVGQICAQFNLKRDAYYKFKKRYLKKKEVETQVLKLVKSSRQILPREGTRKLLKSLKPEFQKHNLKIGRDQLYHILREHNLLIRRKNTPVKLPSRITGFTSMITSLNISTFINPIRYGLPILHTSEPSKDFATWYS